MSQIRKGPYLQDYGLMPFGIIFHHFLSRKKKNDKLLYIKAYLNNF